MGLPVAASQSRTILSLPHVATALPSGLKATPRTEPLSGWGNCRRSRGDWCRQADRLARAACARPGSPASTAERQLSTK